MILIDSFNKEVQIIHAAFFKMAGAGISVDFRTTAQNVDRKAEALIFVDYAANAYVCGTKAQYIRIDTAWKIKMAEQSEAVCVPAYSIFLCSVEGAFVVFSTVDKPEDYLGCLACFGGLLGGARTPAGVHLTNGLSHRLKCANEPFNPIRTKVQLFIYGTIALTADSEEEYAHMMEKLHRYNFVTDATVRADCWDDLCRYVFYNTERRVVSARFRLPDGVDSVMGVAEFFNG